MIGLVRESLICHSFIPLIWPQGVLNQNTAPARPAYVSGITMLKLLLFYEEL